MSVRFKLDGKSRYAFRLYLVRRPSHVTTQRHFRSYCMDVKHFLVGLSRFRADKCGESLIVQFGVSVQIFS